MWGIWSVVYWALGYEEEKIEEEKVNESPFLQSILTTKQNLKHVDETSSYKDTLKEDINKAKNKLKTREVNIERMPTEQEIFLSELEKAKNNLKQVNE